MIPKFIAGFLITSCITILYCVSYNKVESMSLITNTLSILNIIYILINVYIAFKDIEYKIITNKSNLILFITGLIIYTLQSIVENKITLLILLKNLLRKLIIMMVIFIILILLRKIVSNNIGGGDIKMIFALMIKFNLNEMLNILIISIFTSFIYAMYLILIKHKEKNYKFSFGEFIALGVIITMITY